MTIDVGDAAIDRNATNGSGRTIVSKGNPANATGTITAVDIFVNTALSGTNKLGSFIDEGGNFLTHRDSASVGAIVGTGLKTVPALSIDVEIGDYWGAYNSAGSIEAGTSGGAGAWFIVADAFSGTTEFGFFANELYSVYATGEEPAAGGFVPRTIIMGYKMKEDIIGGFKGWWRKIGGIWRPEDLAWTGRHLYAGLGGVLTPQKILGGRR